ncbi:hypothetical protein ACWIJ6_11705 [Aeromonas piscicola]
MNMIDLYLKASSQTAMMQTLKAAGFNQDPDGGSLYHPDAAIDVIGTIYQPTSETNLIDGEQVPVMTAAPGYHVNVRTTSQALADALADLRTYPVTPARVWA